MNDLLSLQRKVPYLVCGALLLSLIVYSPIQAAPVGSYAELVAALQAAGVTVTPGGDIDQSFIPVKGHLITVNKVDVQVFEFKDEAARQQVSDAISQAENSVNTTLSGGVSGINFWATGRLIVLYIGDDQATINTLTKILGNTITPAPAAAGPSSPATLAAQKRLAAALGVTANQVQLVSAEQTNWPNTCLGLTPPGQACADKVTPGWRMIFSANGQQYEVRTNETASVVRWQPQAGPDISLSGLKSQAINAEKQIEKDVQQAGLKEEFTKLEKQLGISGPAITRAWNDFLRQANTVLKELSRDVSQLAKNIQTSGTSK